MQTTRKAALSKGEKYYNTGKPCKYGHYSKRYTSSWDCFECNNRRSKSRWHTLSKAEKDRRIAKDAPRLKKWRLENAEHYRKYQAAYRAWQRKKKLDELGK